MTISTSAIFPVQQTGRIQIVDILQIPISHWWMKRFYYGPAEWLWRSLMYLKPQPMKRTN